MYPEYKVVATRRSGHHAIMYWIMSQFPGAEYPKTMPNISRFRVRPDSIIVSRNGFGESLLLNNLIVNEYASDVVEKKKDDLCLLMKSYEDPASTYLNDVESTYLVVLRDPFNTMASYLQSSQQVRRDVVNLWKRLALEFLEEGIIENKICINYNKWVLDKEYRMYLCDILDLYFTDIGLRRVPPQGRGSSYEGTLCDGAAGNMQVFRRWEKHVDDPRYKTLLCDVELLELSEAIFDFVPRKRG